MGPWDSHFGAVALGDATGVIAHQKPLLEALYVQLMQLIPKIRVLAGVVFIGFLYTKESRDSHE